MSQVLKKSKVILVPTKQAAEGCLIRSLGKRLSYPKAQYFTQDYLKHAQLDALHMYVLSEDKPNVGQYYYNKACDVPNPLGPVITKCEYQHEAESCKNYKPEDIFTAIASTDDSLTYFHKPCMIAPHGADMEIPSPSEGFINRYIENYNKGRIIEDVMVEYEDLGGEEWMGDDYTGEPFWNEVLRPKVRKDNTIIITEIKDTWSREEIHDILHEYGSANCPNPYYKGRRQAVSWFNENY